MRGHDEPSGRLGNSHYLMVAILAATACIVQPVNAEQSRIEFNRDIRPVLSDNCLACHGPDPAARKAGMRLDTKEGLFGTSKKEGPVITPGDPAKSALWKRLITTDADDRMPPAESHKELKPSQLELIRNWIAQGAVWQPHWSFIKPEKRSLPSVKNASWVRQPLDAFVLSVLEARGLEPAPEADRHTLARRVALDLTGLPPSFAEAESFVNDTRPNAYERWVERLLESPAWGEHRARYWLDAARYADTHGYHFDNYREMWPYRDWVIEAFNRNLSFDRFTMEQLAGDLLPDPSPEQLVATGFQRCNMTTNEGGTIEEENLAIYANDRVSTTGWVWLGLTMNCAACHDHKFDPVTTRDFYSMAAFYRNTTQPGLDGNVKDSKPILVVPKADDEIRWRAIPKEVAAQNQKIEKRQQAAGGKFQEWLQTAPLQESVSALSDSSLVAHLPLNEGEGNVVNGTTNGPAAFTTEGKLDWKSGGKLGAAPVLKKDTTLNLGDIGDFEKDQPFSYGAWVNVPSAGRMEAVIARMDQGNNFRGWDLFTHDLNYAAHVIHRWPDDALKVVTTSNPLKPGEWQHVFVTYDGSGKAAGLKIFINGVDTAVRLEVDKLTDSIRTTVPLRVGQRSKDQRFNDGQVQDIRVYARKLEPAEVRTLADASAAWALLAIPTEKRTSDQSKVLLDFFLRKNDPDYVGLRNEVSKLEMERDAIRRRSPTTHIQHEKADAVPVAHVLYRGQYDQPRDKVEAAVVAALNPLPPGAPRNRLGLAEWLVSPENPLTARVAVNRFWQEVFGVGLVKTADDFGIMGDAPANQELLDWLAADFVETGWDVKRFFRQLVTCSTYRQAAVTTEEKLEKDPFNRWLSRGPRFRMDAEMVRDYALSVSGLLRPTVGGPSVKPYQPEGVWEAVAMPESNTRNYRRDTGDALYRRSLYTFWKRSAPPASMDIFNAPSREVTCTRRERTNTPLQALATLNDVQMVEAARRLSESALKRAAKNPQKAVEMIAREVLGRELKPQEEKIVQGTLEYALKNFGEKAEDARQLIAIGETKPDPDLPATSLASLTMVANQLLNLDEVLNK